VSNLLHSGIKQHDAIAGAIRRFQFVLLLMVQSQHRLALKENRRIMFERKWDDVYLTEYFEHNGAIEVTDMPDRYVFVTRREAR
jgi:hypothetical protein